MTLIDFIRTFLALVVVLSLIGVGAVAAQRLGLGDADRSRSGNGGLRSARARRKRRLALVDVMAIDQKRKAAILSCDGVEHLLVLNASGVTVIERRINQQEASSSTQQAAPYTHEDTPRRTSTATQRPLSAPDSAAPSRRLNNQSAAKNSYLALPEPGASSANSNEAPSDEKPALAGNIRTLLRQLKAAAPAIARRLRPRRPNNAEDGQSAARTGAPTDAKSGTNA